MMKSLFKGHLGIIVPACCTISLVVQIVQVVHVLIGFHLKRVEQIAGIAKPFATATSLQPKHEVLPIKAEPGVVSTASLIEMYHLMVLQIAEARERFGFLGSMSDDVAEKGHTFIALFNPSGFGYSRHIADATGS